MHACLLWVCIGRGCTHNASEAHTAACAPIIMPSWGALKLRASALIAWDRAAPRNVPVFSVLLYVAVGPGGCRRACATTAHTAAWGPFGRPFRGEIHLRAGVCIARGPAMCTYAHESCAFWGPGVSPSSAIAERGMELPALKSHGPPESPPRPSNTHERPLHVHSPWQPTKTLPGCWDSPCDCGARGGEQK